MIGLNSQYKGLIRKVICSATKRPTITFTPSIITFENVIINKNSKTQQRIIDIKVKNVGPA